MTNCNHNATLVNTEELSMPALTIKNIPDSLYQQLKTAAELHRRSINSEVIVCLEKTLAATKITPADRLSRIEQMRSSIKTNNITPEDIELAINSGRP
jgi:plasmid stability protein